MTLTICTLLAFILFSRILSLKTKFCYSQVGCVYTNPGFLSIDLAHLTRIEIDLVSLSPHLHDLPSELASHDHHSVALSDRRRPKSILLPELLRERRGHSYSMFVGIGSKMCLVFLRRDIVFALLNFIGLNFLLGWSTATLLASCTRFLPGSFV